MHTISRPGMSLLSYVHVYMLTRICNAVSSALCTYPTHSHNFMDTDAQAHTQLYLHQNTFMPTHTSMCQHPSIPYTCIHVHVLARVHTHTLALTRKH